MRCEDAVVDVAPLLSGDLAPDEERALLEHLATCATCQREADLMREVWARLGEVPIEPPDSERLRARVSAAVGALDGDVVATPSSSPPRAPTGATAGVSPGRPSGTQGRLQWAASLAAALVMGVLLGREISGRPAAPPAELSALRQELRDTREMVTLALLRQSSATERLRGVNWTERIEDPGADVMAALLDALAHDPNVNVRLAAVDALVRYADRPSVRTRAVAALTGSPSDPLVQVALIDLLVQLREPTSKVAFQQLVKDADADPTVRDRATRALRQLGAL